MRQIKKQYLKKPWEMPADDENYPPRPWEVARKGQDPVLFRCLQGYQEFWQHYQWMPFWCALSAGQQEAIKKEAPDQAWIEWLNLSSSFCESFLQHEKLKASEQHSRPLYYCAQAAQYGPTVRWGIPLMVAQAMLLSFYPAGFLFFHFSSPILYFLVFFSQAVFVAACTSYIIKFFKMRSPELAYRLTIIGFCLGYLLSWLVAALAYPNQAPLELITHTLYGFLRDAGWFLGFRAVSCWLVWSGVFMGIVCFGVMFQVYFPYSEASGNWCRRLKLPHQRLVVNQNGLTPYQENNIPYDPTEYEEIAGIVVPRKADPVWFFKFLSRPCLRIVIYFDESTEYNYIHVIFRKGLAAENVERLRAVNQADTRKIVDRFSRH